MYVHSASGSVIYQYSVIEMQIELKNEAVVWRIAYLDTIFTKGDLKDLICRRLQESPLVIRMTWPYIRMKALIIEMIGLSIK